MKHQAIELSAKSDHRGNLLPIEGEKDVPFPIARVYFLFGMSELAERGHHTHRRQSEFAICLRGTCTFTLDDTLSRRAIHLTAPTQGLLIPPMVWRSVSDISSDCLIAVFNDGPFDESDYIRDYLDFEREAIPS